MKPRNRWDPLRLFRTKPSSTRRNRPTFRKLALPRSSPLPGRKARWPLETTTQPAGQERWPNSDVSELTSSTRRSLGSILRLPSWLGMTLEAVGSRSADCHRQGSGVGVVPVPANTGILQLAHNRGVSNRVSAKIAFQMREFLDLLGLE